MDNFLLAHTFDCFSVSTAPPDEYPPALQHEHAISILRNLQKDRKDDQEFCDALICTESRNFSIHKCVVAAASAFFQKLFSSKMKESYESKVNISNVSAEIMEVILDFIYTSVLNISDDNVYDLLCAADYFQMQSIKDFCSFYLKESTSDDNWHVVWKFAKLYSMEVLVMNTELYITANFSKILQRSEYKQLSVDLFLDFLSLRSNVKEIDIFNSVMFWIRHDDYYRMEHLPRVFLCVNLEKLPTHVLKDCVSKEDMIYKSPKCAKLLVEEICNRVQDKKLVSQSILVVGGTPSETDVLKVDINSQEVSRFSCMPIGRSGAGSVLVGDHLYVVGGNSYKENVSNSYNSMISLNLKSDLSVWDERPSMNHRRRCAGCVLLDNYIYVCGGKAHNSMWLSSAERFHLGCQNWSNICEMNFKRAEFCLVTLNGLLYAIGGSNRPYASLDAVECFNPIVGTWTQVNSMNIARSKFAATVLDDEIYVMGGESEHEYLITVEKFSIKTGIWFFLASLNESRYNHAACLVGGEIYLVGGNNKLEFYDNESQEWKIKFTMDRKLGCSVVTLCS